MRVLLLHREDRLPLPSMDKWEDKWDLIADLGNSPVSVYEAWRQEAGCPVVSLSSYARGFEDIYALKRESNLAHGLVVDKFGIDWWDVLLPMLYSDLNRCWMLLRLAKDRGNSVQLFCSRPDPHASALQEFLGVECSPLPGTSSALARKVRHYREVFSHLDFDQITQIVRDKFDPEHSLRRRLARKKSHTGQPVFLLPTAYVNASRTAVSYATMLPEEQFLLAVARPSGKWSSLPRNVRMISLDAYFERSDEAEVAGLIEKWKKLQGSLDAPEFRMASALGVLQRGPELLRWGIAARDAWMRLFASEKIIGCLSADDANPYSSLPLFIAARRNIPSLAVHHGALDGRMAAKPLIADYYLAKGELEQDYLLNSCRVDPDRIVMGGPPQLQVGPVASGEKRWLVFFSEPYGSEGWRMEDVYRELLPHLSTLAGQCGLKLVFKLHPFESIKGHKNLLRRFLPPDQFTELRWFAGPITPELWSKTRFAMTVESTIALECAIREIPVFLCAWLRSVYGSYIEQYAKFGVGHILNSPDEMQNVPNLLANWNKSRPVAGKIWRSIDPAELRSLLTGTYKRKPVVAAPVGAPCSDHFS